MNKFPDIERPATCYIAVLAVPLACHIIYHVHNRQVNISYVNTTPNTSYAPVKFVYINC